METFRLDNRIRCVTVKRTDAGVIVSAPIAKEGILVYKHADGSITREFVSKEELLRDDSVDSLKFAPITDGHPYDTGGIVTKRTFKQKAIGVVGSAIKNDTYLNAEFSINSEDGIVSFDKGKQDLSAGYTCTVVKQDGTWNGQQYDHIQTNRKYNHVALVWAGRAGSDVSAKTDSAEDNEIIDLKLDQGDNTMDIEALKKLHLDEQNAIKAEFQTKLDRADAEKTALQSKLDALQAEIPELIDKAVKEHDKVITIAKTCLDEADYKDANVSDVKVKCIAKKYPNIKLDDKSEEYKNALFDTIVATPAQVVTSGLPLATKNDSVDDTNKKILDVHTKAYNNKK